MTISDEVLQRLIAQVRSGIDVVIDADPAAQRLITVACSALKDVAGVIMVASPVGELSLSSLIAQISGRPDFDGQDDSVLELGFKRLHAAGRRTVLVLQAPHGTSRSALRYVQHVSRHAAGLVLVVLASPALDALLEEPVFSALRARLRAAPAFGAGAVALPHAPPLLVEAAPPRRRRLFWAASALGIAATTAAVAWVGYGPTLARPAGSTRLQTSMPIAPAVTASPPPAQMQRPAMAALADVAAEASPMPRRLDTAIPPSARLALAEAAVVPPPPPLATLDRTIVVRRAAPLPRDYSRYARVRRSWHAHPPEVQEFDRYAGDQTYPEPPPPWVTRQDQRYGDTRYLRPYAVDRFGTPLYGYDD